MKAHRAIDDDAAQFARALRHAILLPVAVILVAAALAFLIGYQFFQAMARSDHSRQAGRQILFIHGTLLDMETSQLRYQLHGQPEFLQDFDRAGTHVDADFADLRQLVKGNKELEVATDQLIQAKNAWLQHAHGSIAQRGEGKIPDDDWARVGNTLQDNLNRRLSSVVNEQIKVRDERLRDVDHEKFIFIATCAGLALVLALTVAQIVRRQMASLALGHRQALQIIQQRHAALVRSESELAQQKEWFRVTLMSIGDGVIVTDHEGRVVFVNQEAENLTGWPSVEALLNPLGTVFRLVDEATREKMESSGAQAFRLDRRVSVSPNRRALLLSRGGEEWPIEDTASPIHNPAGELLGIVMVFHNATDIRQAQDALREHSDELERKVAERTATLRQAVAQLDTFSYSVSHDLRSPLRAMRGFAGATLEDYGDKLDEQGREYLTRIIKAGDRLDRMIQDLLSYTRLARADTPLQSLDLDKIIRDIIDTYPNLRAPAAEAEIVGTLPHVWGQESALTQVVANLLGNAVKFVKPGLVPKIRLSAEAREKRIRLWIEDNGIGVDPANAERIFTMFVRVNEAKYSGTGVGLAIVKKAVEIMQGSVGVEPGVNGGSRFWFELTPVQGEGSPAAAPKE